MANRLPHGAVLIATLYVFVVSPLHAEEISHLLDGMTFVGNNGKKAANSIPMNMEEIIFKNGRFRSVSATLIISVTVNTQRLSWVMPFTLKQ